MKRKVNISWKICFVRNNKIYLALNMFDKYLMTKAELIERFIQVEYLQYYAIEVLLVLLVVINYNINFKEDNKKISV